MNPQEYRLNIRPGCGISPTVKVSQGDIGRPLVFNMLDGTDALEITSGTTVTMKGLKPSGLGFTANCSWTGSQVSILTAEAMTQEPGAVAAELIFTLRSSVIGTANFVLYVEPAAHPEGTTDGTIAEAKTVLQQAEAAADRAEKAAEAISQAGIDTTGSTAGQVPTANGAGGWTWGDQQGGGTSDDIENKSSVSGATVTGALNTLSDQIANIQGGAPTPVSTVSGMVDTTKIYLYVGSESGYTAGHWYYYSNGSWVDGGAYGEAASMSAGVKEALLACFRKVAWIDENGQTYYNNLYNALYPPANLVSITAVYTQSGTVYDTSSLDDLKPDLVVTANYSDSTSETVTTYTLSGTLAVGTSTITVSYGGKTASFSVTVSEQGKSDMDGWTDGIAYTDLEIVENSYCISNTGAIKSYNGWSRTGYVPCDGASSLTFPPCPQEGASFVNSGRFYDANHTVIGGEISGSSTLKIELSRTESKTINVLAGASYFMISSDTSALETCVNAGIVPHA